VIHATPDQLVLAAPCTSRSDIGSPRSGSFVAFGEGRHRDAYLVDPSPKAPAVAGGKPMS
jgi:hypothetical protein